MNKQKNLLVICFGIFLGINFSFAQKKTSKRKSSQIAEVKTSEKKVTISGNASQTYPYCGGARPTPEILEQLSQPKPVIGKKFHVIKGEKNSADRKIILSFTTDSSGNFSFKLPPD